MRVRVPGPGPTHRRDEEEEHVEEQRVHHRVADAHGVNGQAEAAQPELHVALDHAEEEVEDVEGVPRVRVRVRLGVGVGVRVRVRVRAGVGVRVGAGRTWPRRRRRRRRRAP